MSTHKQLASHAISITLLTDIEIIYVLLKVIVQYP